MARSASSMTCSGKAPIGARSSWRLNFHVCYGGPNETTVTVVSTPGNGTFGSIWVGNNILKEGPESSSMLIGRTYDLTVQASIESPSAYLYMLNFVFTTGKYDGSSISIVGNEVVGETMERAIVGGTGKFRMAWGYTISRLISSTGTTELLLVHEHDAYIYHY
ncbi:unnamed protein product [Musa acuminata subsp. malaccensis]|uniref:Dirigent protein n=1 Tax=Musa acuminata subsp. malaccensis TaxID=214687 RepID=A0A804K8I7_MUSAM|nr:PREDICTED: dirigent protein 22-like [Musa acuminata subsp. malaccensis]CAG1832138.1 unnamed protein product [Musa acuminata subsp. malaccensis]